MIQVRKIAFPRSKSTCGDWSVAEPPMSYNEPPIQEPTDLAESYHAAKRAGPGPARLAVVAGFPGGAPSRLGVPAFHPAACRGLEFHHSVPASLLLSVPQPLLSIRAICTICGPLAVSAVRFSLCILHSSLCTTRIPTPAVGNALLFGNIPCCFLATSTLRFGNMPPPESVVFSQHSKARGIAVKKVTL